jgi:hypothetical protein
MKTNYYAKTLNLNTKAKGMTDNMYSVLATSQLKPGPVPTETPTSRKNKKRLERQRAKKQHELEITRAEVRTNAFTTLSDKELLGNKLRKTRLCRSVLDNTPCRHGESCRFAHTEAELLVSECLFGDQCRFVTMKDGVLVNHGLRICKHKHPQESVSSFEERIAATSPPLIPIPCCQPVQN